MGIRYKYDAFISYRHVSPDKEIAGKLQKKLESYTPPKELRKGKKRGKWRVFRDETELPTSSDLSKDIRTALEQSEFLIVICSKTTKDSRWCMEEISYFKELHNGNNANIITLVVDGNPEDIFPPMLCNELIPVTDEYGNTTYQNHIIEPLAANVSGKNLKDSLKKLNTEFLRIAAPILGCGYDNLYNRAHRNKIRRLFVMGAVVIAFLLCFGIYNSAMLWKINNQKKALASANTELQSKTVELNLSNENLKTSNAELAEKTKEAEDNFAEANKQKKAAEDNLAEAEKQRKNAVENLAEANRQKKIAEENLTEANRQKKLAEENLTEANRQKKMAEDNLTEANRQQQIAEQNAQEANTQREMAESNLTEANRQKKIAEDNALEANAQREIAEENRRIAQKNEAEANEANKNLRAKTSEIFANQAKMFLENDDVYAAAELASEAIALNETNTIAENVLINATGVYNSDERMIRKAVKLSGYVDFLEFSEDGRRVFATDNNGIAYVIDALTGEMINVYTPHEAFGETSSKGVVRDVVVDGNCAFVLCNDQLMAIDLNDGTVKWHYNNKEIYIYLYEIVNNKESEYIVLTDKLDSGVVISKFTGEEIFSFEKEEPGYNDYWYLSSDEKIYVADSGLKNVVVYDINNKSQKQFLLDVPEKCNIIAMAENENCIFMNLRITGEQGRMICLNKADVSVKWSTDYNCKYLSEYSLNKIFELKHRQLNDTGAYEITGIIGISGTNVIAFEKESGKIYFKVGLAYEEELLYCEPNDGYSIKIADSEKLAVNTFLMNRNGDVFKEDTLGSIDTIYTFDKKRKYIAYDGVGRYAVASENSSEISIYYSYVNSNYTLLENIGELNYLGFDRCVDNGEGIFAGHYSEYKDERKDYIIIYDVNNNKLLVQEQLPKEISQMCFVGKDILFMIDKEGTATALKTDGTIVSAGNILSKIYEAVGIPETTHINTLSPYIYQTETGVLYCIEDGIFEINISEEDMALNKILYTQKNCKQYCISEKFTSFVEEDFWADSCKIAYMKPGEPQVYYVRENGDDANFKADSVVSVTNNRKHDIAFISKEGYIGLYRHGDDKISKIQLPPDEVMPLKILFTPDCKYIIAMCADGEFIKFSTENLHENGRFKSSLVIGSSLEMEFIDDFTFMVREYNFSTDIILVDTQTMEQKAEINKFLYFMKNDKKILFSSYMGENKVTGYYNYISQNDLLEIADGFLSESGQKNLEIE